jgi:hypothetical protein
MLAPAVALKVALAVPDAIVTDAGTVRAVLLLASVTVEPAAGAGCVNVTVQVLTSPWPVVFGLHTRSEINPGAIRLILAVFELAPNVAVSVAV